MQPHLIGLALSMLRPSKPAGPDMQDDLDTSKALELACLALRPGYPDLHITPATLQSAIEQRFGTDHAPPDANSWPPRKYLGYALAEDYVGAGRVTLWREHKAGRLPMIRLGKRVMFDVDDLDALMRRRKCKPKTWRGRTAAGGSS